MKLIRHLLAGIRCRREPQHARYGAEVLLAGWVKLPEAFHERRAWSRARAIPYSAARVMRGLVR